MIITTKVISVCLGVTVTAFIVSTTVLAVQNSKLQNDLQEARQQLELLEESLKTTTESTVTTTTAQPSEPTINYRLPNTMNPIHYDLYLHPKVDEGNFSGQVRITINVVKPTDQIILHSNGLIINNVYLTNAGSNTIYVKRHYLDTVREFLVVELSEPLEAPRTFYLGIIFEGSMLNKIIGLYSSSYVKADESKKWIATSKFEPTYARQAFPCFDEPAMKATFEITLAYKSTENYHALSNMDIESIKNQGDNMEAYFNKSVPMSTYLTCFIVSDFEAREDIIDTKGIGDPFRLRVFATPEQIDKVKFALEVGKPVIEYYIDYFQIEYPLPKLDMAAIPDFVSGAMEHWGLVTYRETALLYDAAVSSTANKQRIASVIAHEFAHMWFGNLVTMNWWNDLWLNEGFASYIENKGVDSVFPEWKMQDQFITGTLHPVLTLDATLGSHPIVQSVENPDQITEIFDTITYSKGSSIIRMLEDFIEPLNFQKAVTNYLNEFKYKNAVTDDFLTEIDKLNLGIDIKQIMETWTEQMGFPVVEITQDGNIIKLNQRRFFSNPDDYDGVYNDSIYNYTWDIPITYKTSLAPTTLQTRWFYHNEREITIVLDNAVEWIKFNNDQVGYYRVNYDSKMWYILVNQLINNPNIFTIGDRAGLLNDAFSLADATQLSYDVAFELTQYLIKENDYVPWSVAASKLTSLKRSLMFTDTFLNYILYAKQLVKPIYEEVTWNVGDDHLKNRLRVTILSTACSLGLEECLSEVSQHFQTFLENPEVRPHPDIRETVYFYGIMQVRNEEAWQKMWNLFVAEEDASEKSKLMYGLSGVQIPWLISRYVELAWNEEYVRGQDYFTCLQYIAANPMGEPIVWDYVRENWERLVDRFGLNERYLGNMIPSITSRFSTKTKLEEMESFFEKHPQAGAGTAARIRALETVKNNIVWLENNKDSIGNWLTQHNNLTLRDNLSN